jgi:glyoxylase-like metal-dependent hydrolase (beta-lactamase superfamily II)
VVLTHIHNDHSGGLKYFRHARILLSGVEWRCAQGLAGKIAGYPNNRWPAWLAPMMLSTPPAEGDLFKASIPLTSDGAVRVMATPGHTSGHLAVSVETEAATFLLAGDASYLQATLLAMIPDGVGADPRQQVATHHRIVAAARQRPIVYLNGHDPDCARRLAAREPLPG